MTVAGARREKIRGRGCVLESESTRLRFLCHNWSGEGLALGDVCCCSMLLRSRLIGTKTFSRMGNWKFFEGSA